MGAPQPSFRAQENHNVDQRLAKWAQNQAQPRTKPSGSHTPTSTLDPSALRTPHPSILKDTTKSHLLDVAGIPPGKEGGGWNRWQAIPAAIIPLLLILTIWALLSGPGITGLATYQGNSYQTSASVTLDTSIAASRNITIDLHDAPLTVAISGTIQGAGRAIHRPSGLTVFDSGILGRDAGSARRFLAACKDTCQRTAKGWGGGPQAPSNLTIEILLEPGSTFNISSIEYTYQPGNHPPRFNGRLANLTARPNQTLDIDFLSYANDLDNDTLTFLASGPEHSGVDIQTLGTTLRIKTDALPPGARAGAASVVLFASDLKSVTRLNTTITITGSISDEELTAANAPFPIDSGIVEKAAMEDGTPVIIEFETPNNALGERLKEQAIRGNAQAIRQETSPDEVGITDEYTSVPAIAAQVTAQGLQELMANPLVKAVHQDEEFSVENQETPGGNENLWDERVWNGNRRTLPNGTMLDGAGQTACVIDTGTQASHPDLDGRVIDGYNALTGASGIGQANDDNGHGTAVAGIIASPDGMAPGASLFPVKACDARGSCRASAILSAIDACIGAAVRLNITVITASVGDGKGHDAKTCPRTLDTAIASAHDKGITLVFPSGNNGFSDGVAYPACDSRAISVGSSTPDDTIAPFTNRGSRLDILAPGTNVITTMPGGGHGPASGTSISAPFVAGAAIILNQALATQARDQQTRGQARGQAILSTTRATPEQVKEALIKNSATAAGYPRLDMSQAIGAIDRISSLPSSEDKGKAQTETGPKPTEIKAEPKGLIEKQAIRGKLAMQTTNQKTSPLVIAGIKSSGSAKVIIELQPPQRSATPEWNSDGFSTSSLDNSPSDPLSMAASPSKDGVRPSKESIKESLKGSIKAARDSALGALKASHAAPTGRSEFRTLSTDEEIIVGEQPEYLPYITGTVAASAIPKLEENPAVKSVRIDAAREVLPRIIDPEPKPNFDASIPSIGAAYARDTLNHTGLGVKVAIIDTGIDYTHPDLGNCTQSQFLAGTCAKVPLGAMFCGGTPGTCARGSDPLDDFGHGSHVAGIIGGTGQGGLKGVAPNATFIAIKSCDSSGSCPDSAVIAGIDYAIAHGADIISMSLGSNPLPNDGSDSVSQAAALAAAAYGVTVIAAAGNSGPGTGSVAAPAAGDGVISVAASNDAGTANADDDTIASFSDRGPMAFGRFGPDISAPGVSINSTVPPASQCPTTTVLCSNTRYKIGSGTSFSTPHVAGVAALLLQQDPARGPADIRSILLATATNISGHAFSKGAGLLNATGALTWTVRGMMDSAEKTGIEIQPGHYRDVNITVIDREGSGSAGRIITLLAEAISEPDGNNTIAAANIILPHPFAIGAGANRTATIRIKAPSASSPGVYAGAIVGITNQSESFRLPYALTVPLFSKAITTGRTADSASGSKTGDIMYHKITSPNASAFSVTLSWPNPADDLDLYLFSEGGILVGMSAGLSDPEQITVNTLHEKTYWIAVNGFTVPVAGTMFNVSVAPIGNISISPASMQASALTNESKTLAFTIRNDAAPKSLTATINRLSEGSSVSTTRDVPSGGADYFSFPHNGAPDSGITGGIRGGINTTGIKLCEANITWSDPGINLDLSYFSSSDNGTTNTTRPPSSAHDNGQLGIAAETITAADVEFLSTTFNEWGVRISNSNNTATNATLSISCRNNLPAPEASVAPSGLALAGGEEANVTASIDASALAPGSAIDYGLSLRLNGGGGGDAGTGGGIEIGRAPMTITVAAPPEPIPTFDGDTTDLSSVPDISAVPSMTLEITGKGRVRWDAPIDARGVNFSRDVIIDRGFVAFNATELHPTLNTSAGITISGVTCDGYLLQSTGVFYQSREDVMATGHACTAGSDPSCTSIACAGNTLSFQTSHLSSYAIITGLSNSAINESAVQNSTVSGTNISRSQVNGSSLHSSSISNATMSRATATNSTIDNATIRNATITNGRVNRSTLNFIISFNTSMVSSILENSTVENATVANASLISSLVNRSAIENATLQGTNATDAVINSSQVNRSTIQNSTVLDTIILLSTINASFVDPSNVTNSSITASFVEDSRVDNSSIFTSNVTNSTINASLIIDSNIRNSTVKRSTIHNWTLNDTVTENQTISNGDNLTCGQNIAASLNLSTNVLAAGTCYHATADQITINCNNFNITGLSPTAPLINITGRHGVAILNCRLSGSPAALISGSNSSQLINLSAGQKNITITGTSSNNTILDVANASQFILTSTAGHNTILNLTTASLTISGTANNITNSSVSSIATVSGANNTLHHNDFAGSGNKISLSGTGHLVANNTLAGNIALGPLTYSTITENNLTGGCIGIITADTRDTLTLSSNRILSCAGGGVGINFQPDFNTNITITNNKILSTSTALSITGGSTYTILNNTFNSSGRVKMESIETVLFANNTINNPTESLGMDISNISGMTIMESIFANATSSASVGLRFVDTTLGPGALGTLAITNNTFNSIGDCIAGTRGQRFNNTRFFGNIFTSCGRGIRLEANGTSDSADINVSHNQFFSTSIGIHLRSIPNTIIENTRINASGNTSIYIEDSIGLLLYNATITNTGHGIVITNSSGPTARDVFIANASREAVFLNNTNAGLFNNLTLNSSSTSLYILGNINHTVNGSYIPGPVVLENHSVAKLNFTAQVNFTNNSRLITVINLSNNTVAINASLQSQFNVSAIITLNVSFSEAKPGYDSSGSGTAAPCEAARCTVIAQDGNMLSFNVTGFSRYTTIPPVIKSTITASTVNGTVAENLTATGSVITNSTVNRTISTNSTIDNSTVTNTSLRNSTVDNSSVTNTTSEVSRANSSTILQTALINSTMRNSFANDTIIENSTVLFSNLSFLIVNRSIIHNSSHYADYDPPLDGLIILASTINLTQSNLTDIITNSTVERAIIKDTTIDNSTFINSTDDSSTINKSRVENSTTIGAEITSSSINQSFIQDSTVNFTNATQSHINNTAINASRALNSTFLQGEHTSSIFINSTILNGEITQSYALSSTLNESIITLTNATLALINFSTADTSNITNSSILSSIVNATGIDNTTITNASAQSVQSNTSVIMNSSIVSGIAFRSVVNASFLTAANLSNATAYRLSLNATQADNTSAAYSNLTMATLNKSSIDTSFIRNSTVLSGAINLSRVDAATIANSTIANATINLSRVANSTIANSTTLRSTLNITVAENSTAINSSVRGAYLNSSIIDNSTSDGTNLTGSASNQSDTFNSTLTNSTVTESLLVNAILTNSSVNGSTVTNSNLTNVTVQNSTIIGENIINDAIVNGLSVASCTKVLIRNTISTQNLSCPGVGLTINLTNPIIDCQGFTMRGSDTSIGIEVNGISNVTIKNCAIANFTYNIVVNSTNGTIIRGVTSQGGPVGVFIANSSNITVDNLISTNNTQAGILIDPSDNITVENSTFSGSPNAILLLDTNNSRFAFNLIENSTVGMNLTRSYTNQIRNNTIRRNGRNIVITSGERNTIFINAFSLAGSLHIQAGAGNSFNTTFAGVQAGNNYDNIAGLRIYDTDADGFGDSGPDRPYNSTNGGNVSVNVSDFFPITTRQDQAPTIASPIPDLALISPQTAANIINLNGAFSDPDSDPLTFTATNLTLGVIIAGGLVTIQVPINFTGPETITFFANDSTLLTNTSISVTGSAAVSTASLGTDSPSGGKQSAPESPPPAPPPPPPAPAPTPAPAPPVSIARPPTVLRTGVPQALLEFPGIDIEQVKRVAEVPISCGYTTKKSIEQQVVPRASTLDDIKVPEGYKIAASPFNFTCGGDSLDLTFTVPEGFTDLKALRCKKNQCTAIIEKEVTTKELVCGGKTLSQIREESLIKKKDVLTPEEVDIIAEEGKLITRTDATVSSGKNLVEFTGAIPKPFRAAIGSPKNSVPLPKNPSAGIIGTPLEISIRDAAGPIPARITIPYLTPDNYDPGTFAIFARSDGTWAFLDNSARDEKSKTISVKVDDVLKHTKSGTAQFAVVGVGCLDCQKAKLTRVYAPEGARTALILLHGFASTPKTWQFFIDEVTLTNQPYTIYTLQYSPSQPVAKTAQEFMDLLETQSSQFDKGHILAHSMGGFVTQEALDKAKRAGSYTWLPKIKKVVMAGTPNDGTPGADVYSKLFKSLLNEKGDYGLFNINSAVMADLSKGLQVPRIPAISYYVVAGIKPYEFNLGAFTVSTKKLFKLIAPNDGITTTTSAQHVGGAYVNNTCKNYYEINITHTDLIDHPTARRVLQRIVGEDEFKSTGKGLGYNQYLRLRIDKCDPSEKFIIIGKPIKPEEAAAPLNCNCGNGVCGVDETLENCPSDCAIKVERPQGEVATEIAVYIFSTIFLTFVIYRLWRAMRRKERKRLVEAAQAPSGLAAPRQQSALEKLGLLSPEEMAEPEKPARRPDYESLSTAEKIKAELDEFAANIDFYTGDKSRKSRPIFYPPAVREEPASGKGAKRRGDARPGKIGRVETEELRRRLENLQKQYPLATKTRKEKGEALPDERAPPAGSGIGERLKTQLGTIGSELARMLSGKPPIKRPIHRPHHQPKKDEQPGPSTEQARESTPAHYGLTPEEKGRLMSLLGKHQRPHTKERATEMGTTKGKGQGPQNEPSRLSSLIKGELDELFTDTERLIQGAILKRKKNDREPTARTDHRTTTKAEEGPRTKGRSPQKKEYAPTKRAPLLRPAAAERPAVTATPAPQPVSAPAPEKPAAKPSPAARPSPSAQVTPRSARPPKESPRQRSSSALGAELAGLADAAEKLLGLSSSTTEKKKGGQKPAQKTGREKKN